MNMLSRSLLISCIGLTTAYINATTVLEKQVDLGKDPKTNKTIVVKAYSLVEDNAKETADSRWIAVLPDGKELIFFTTKHNLNDAFVITPIISYQQSFDTYIDPTAENPILDPQQAISANQKNSMATMHVTMSPDVQLFKDLAILLAQGNVKGLTTFVNKYGINRIEETITKALDCQGVCFIAPDDPEKLDSLLQTKQPILEPTTLTGKISFIPKEVIEELLIQMLQQEQDNANQKA